VNGVQGSVGDRQSAAAATGALPRHVRFHVGRAPHAAVVLAHTPPELHPAVASGQYHDHLVSTGTARLERLPLTVVQRL